MQRIAIIGSSGSGKSTMARQLGAQLNLPVHHLDKYYWEPDWQPVPFNQWQKTVSDLVAEPSWIIDGNNRKTLDIRLAQADTVIFLDLPRWLSVMRASKRRIQYVNRQRPDIAPGCHEPIFDPSFPKFLRWIWQYQERARPDIINRISHLNNNTKLIWLTSQPQIDAFLEDPHFYASFRPRLDLKHYFA